MSREVTAQETMDLLREAVVERGEDFVYPDEWRHQPDRDADGPGQCLYFRRDGQPACIVGFVLDRLGVTNTDLRSRLFGASAINNQQQQVKFDATSLIMLMHAQMFQDEGNPWGAAAKEAQRKYNEATEREDR